jgi:hypothetical protein
MTNLFNKMPKQNKKKKLSEDQKAMLRVVIAANNYAEIMRIQSKKDSEEWFFEQVEKIINDEY